MQLLRFVCRRCHVVYEYGRWRRCCSRAIEAIRGGCHRANRRDWTKKSASHPAAEASFQERQGDTPVVKCRVGAEGWSPRYLETLLGLDNFWIWSVHASWDKAEGWSQ